MSLDVAGGFISTNNQRKNHMNTEITLPVSELKQALPGLNKITGRKTTLPVLQNVKVSRQKNGLVTLQATDLDSFATYTVNGTQPGHPIELLVPLEQLNKALKCSGSKDEVALICEGKDTKLCYSIAGTPVHQPVTITPVDEWPPVPQIKSESFKLDPAFGPALRQALESCSDDQTRSAFRGACLDVTDKKLHYIVASDGHSLFSANSFTFPLTKSIIIPDSKFLVSGDLLDEEPCFMSVQPGKGRNAISHICLKTSRWEFIVREIDSLFPNWKQVLPTINNKWTQVKLSPSAVSQLLQVIPKLPCEEGGTYPVRLRIEEKCLWVEGRNQKDADWTKVAVSDVTITGKPKTITLNRNYLIQALKFGFDEFAVEAENSPLVFTKLGRKFIISPIGQKPNGQIYRPPAKPTVAQTPQPQPAKERTPMPRAAKTPVASVPQTPPENKGSAIHELLGEVDQIRENLKNVLSSLTNVTGKLKAVEKEKRVTEKEVDAIRKQLRRIQNVKI